MPHALTRGYDAIASMSSAESRAALMTHLGPFGTRGPHPCTGKAEVIDHAGANESPRRLEELVCDKVLTGPVLKTLFTERVPTHVDHLTWFTAESFGSPVASRANSAWNRHGDHAGRSSTRTSPGARPSSDR